MKRNKLRKEILLMNVCENGKDYVKSQAWLEWACVDG